MGRRSDDQTERPDRARPTLMALTAQVPAKPRDLTGRRRVRESIEGHQRPERELP